MSASTGLKSWRKRIETASAAGLESGVNLPPIRAASCGDDRARPFYTPGQQSQMTKTFKIAAEPVPSPLQPMRWSFFVGGQRCGEAATRQDALRCARELVDRRQRDAAARRDGAQPVEKPR